MGNTLAAGLRGAGFASRCNFVFLISVLGLVGLGLGLGLGLVPLGFRISVRVVV